MTLQGPSDGFDGAEWLFAIGEGGDLPSVDGLVAIADYARNGRPPEEVALVEKAAAYGARAVFFEAARHGRAPVAQALVFDMAEHGDDRQFANLHKRLWSWGGVPIVYRVGPGRIQLFRCAHEPDFVGSNGTNVCRPIRTLTVGAEIAAQDAWWDADRIRNGAIWDDPDACRLMLSAKKSAHRTLVDAVHALSNQLSERRLLDSGLQRRLLILSLLIAYLEERSVLLPDDFDQALPGATRFFQVLGNGPALVSLLESLEERFNGHVFRLKDAERSALAESEALASYARLVEGFEDASGQLSLWRLYSFRDLPVELISNIYQLFVKDTASSIYTPPALVRLILEEVLSWKRIDALMEGDGVILDPACGSGVFLVEAYKRLVLHWRWRNGWARPGVEELRPLLQRVHGIDLEDGAVELAAFSLCLSLCDALEPEDIRSSVKLFPPLGNHTLHGSCFFEAKERGLVQAPVAVVVGNPPFESALTTDGAKRSYTAYTKMHGSLADNQLAYLFLHEAMELLAPGGVLAMIEPSGFLYNQNALAFRRSFFTRWNVREVLDFVSVRGLFKKGNADPKVVVVLAESSKGNAESRLLHAVFRRSGRASAEQGFDIDYYDMHWFPNAVAVSSRDIWRANLLGGHRVLDLIQRLRTYPTLRDFAQKREWDFGEGYIAGQKGISRPADHLIGQPLLPTSSLSHDGLDTRFLDMVPDRPIKDTKTARRFTPPMLLIKEHEDLPHGLWTDHYLTYKHEIVGFAAPARDMERLAAIDDWLRREATVLRAYVAGISARLFTQRATAILNADVLSLPYPEDEDLDLSENERIIAADIVEHQREFIRLGARAAVMRPAQGDVLTAFDTVFVRQINAIYTHSALRPLPAQRWPGAICKAYVFGEGEVDWSGADELRKKLDALLHEQRGSGLTITRITRLYDQEFMFLLKPDRHRFWTRSIALRDADDVLADLRAQGF
ncbi:MULTISPECIES: HsdM family class I SAM-dependent methyltransferase [Rhodobacterales]|uniref:site-specific DNA-methyltransferase (adenine-specific) n=1 Tax=Psychromarinibacter halotolerans TaxID=1775175 RepID=A0ABV7GQQ1_9RHOB|nr:MULTISPECIES: N-6 DNA methylase [Rhodobacterales]MBN9890168.1 N-6 DNA methylase [Salipiger abyssi]MDF0598767.1 N-6 DNA methylase [Psychromarinibacter halotolerans]